MSYGNPMKTLLDIMRQIQADSRGNPFGITKKSQGILEFLKQSQGNHLEMLKESQRHMICHCTEMLKECFWKSSGNPTQILKQY